VQERVCVVQLTQLQLHSMIQKPQYNFKRQNKQTENLPHPQCVFSEYFNMYSSIWWPPRSQARARNYFRINFCDHIFCPVLCLHIHSSPCSQTSHSSKYQAMFSCQTLSIASSKKPLVLVTVLLLH